MNRPALAAIVYLSMWFTRFVDNFYRDVVQRITRVISLVMILSVYIVSHVIIHGRWLLPGLFGYQEDLAWFLALLRYCSEYNIIRGCTELSMLMYNAIFISDIRNCFDSTIS